MDLQLGRLVVIVTGAASGLVLTDRDAPGLARIRVNGINLGSVATEGEQRMQAETLDKGTGWQRSAASALPLGRLVMAEECARPVAFLLSDASAPMSGAILDFEQKVAGAI
jgi:NAD(P)-dependent dehydrogenase (short-subunit alcohol dehydrogenase family)